MLQEKIEEKVLGGIGGEVDNNGILHLSLLDAVLMIYVILESEVLYDA